MKRLDVLISKAKAIARVKVRKRKEAQGRSEDSLIERLMAKVNIPTPEAGKDGRDAPTLSEILDVVKPMLPEAKIEHTTIVEKINRGEIEDVVQAMLDTALPEIAPEDRPKVEQITIDVSEDKLDSFVTKEDFDKALVRIQRAIQESSGGGGISEAVGPITNILLADSTTNTFTEGDLDNAKINIVHATVANSVVTLPKLSPSYIVWVEDAVVGGGNITISREV